MLTSHTRSFVLSLILGLAAPLLLAQTCGFPGREGPVQLTGIVNSYYAGAGVAASGASELRLASSVGQRSLQRALVPGDLILVAQMQDSVAPEAAGRFEYAQVKEVLPGPPAIVRLSSALQNTYVQDVRGGSAPSIRTFQAIYVPQLSSGIVRLTARADTWALTPSGGQGTGGIFAVDVAGELTIEGKIDVSGAGFRGGAGVQANCSRPGGTYADLNYPFNTSCYHGGIKGEGVEGTPIFAFSGVAAPTSYEALVGQGYASGSAGREYRSNAGGGGNDGDPPSGANQFNSGGGGGANAGSGGRGGNAWNNNSSGGNLNQPAGGNTGNQAGGLGGAAIATAIPRLLLGGGGGSGGANNSFTGSTVSAWPPQAGGAGASGAIASSGASGAGAVVIRAGNLRTLPGASIDANGYSAYSKSGSDTDGGGGGGAGGSVLINAAASVGAGLQVSARGGAGGSTNNFNHGPGGGGGGGQVFIDLPAALVSALGGASGLDGCCAGNSGNGSPKPYGATSGNGAQPQFGSWNAKGVLPSWQCLPKLQVHKSTRTPTVTRPATTATYVVVIENPASGSGAAWGVSMRDALPAPFMVQGDGRPLSVEYSGGAAFSGGAVVSNVSGTGSTVIFGAPGTASEGFYLPPAGRLTLTFIVDTGAASPATYQNGVVLGFADPTRTTGGPVSAQTNPAVYANGTYASGRLVERAQYDAASSPDEDVRILFATAHLTVQKSNNTDQLVSGQHTEYVVTVGNLGPADANGTVVRDPAADGLACSEVRCEVEQGAAACPAATTVQALQGIGLVLPLLPANSRIALRISCVVTATGQ
jgi:uncharacterized repeat protein (TIGR01451 family)